MITTHQNVMAHQVARQQVNRRRSGLTLVELMVLIAVIVIVTAVMVPSVKFLTADRKIREAAREMNAFISSVQSDAMQTGSGGIWIERDPNSPNTATRLYRVKSPPPYTGDFFGAVVQIVEADANPAEILDGLDNEPNTILDDLFYADIRFSMASAASSIFLIEPGDRIQFDQKGNWFTITAAPTDIGDPDWTSTIRVVSTKGPINVVPAGNPITVSFKVRRVPKRSTVGYLDLPTSTMIDLARSGFTVIDVDNNGLFDDGAIQGNEFLDQGAGGPVIIAFGEDGGVEMVVANGTLGLPDRSLHLLLASDERDDQAELNPDYITNPLVTTATLEELSNYWISINRQGNVSSTQVTDLSSASAVTIGEALRASRSNARLMETDTAN